MTTPLDPARSLPEYSPLPSIGSFIRLLNILPGDHGTVLECNLQVASLRSQLSYKALSYAWIDENVSLSRQEGESIYQDTHERNQQVGMMRSIYSNSSGVLIWLGPNVVGDHLGDGRVVNLGMDNDYKLDWHNDSRDEHMVSSYIERFNEYENLGESVLPTSWSRDVFGAFSVLQQLAQGTFSKNLRFYKASVTTSEQIKWSYQVRKGISAIVDSSWWQRTWVIQETVLPRKATVYLGHVSAPWTMLAEGAATYVRELATSRSDDRDPLVVLTKAILDLESVRIARIEEVRLPLLSMLRRFRIKKSSDPRDKVFALLGLAREHIQASVRPDYSLSEDEVMLRTTIAVISEIRGLEPLAGRVAGPDCRHSWVTNWYELPAGNERERLDCLPLYDACGGQCGIARLHGQALLELQGHFVGEVYYVSDEAPDSGFERLRGFVTQWEAIWRTIGARSSSFEADEFWRTITADTLYVESLDHSSWLGQDAKYRRATSNGAAAFEAWREDDTRKRRRKTSHGPAGLLKNYVEPEELTALKNSFHYAVQTASGSRTFFLTKNGFIGIGPANLRPGDEIYIVLGSRVPLIMRRRSQSTRCLQEPVRNLFDYPGGVQTNIEVCSMLHDHTHALVGDAYVHGVMDSEFVRGLRRLQSIYVL
ncbi:hypothetical protein GQ43DRAFT_426245 [Delitschia confertaspora ATCC 74209]|uniref:Heterokaryon incompatibility domain-containing protein n=1 Tax=Delitschia confertaspora ATCC 74209 TaxID=1513339 RepID=A0A9P4MMZ5_9PLEO|nr:hypothetical protein GQ43DRAFT_426245 [Delitschia confertaspora ATCC 74209]